MSAYDVSELDFRGSSFSESEFNRFYDEYYDKIHNYLYFRTGSEVLADDLTGQIIEKVLNGICRFDAKKSNLNTWIFTIVKNSLIDYYRRSSRTETYFEEGEERKLADEAAETAEENLLRKERQEIAAELLSRLPEKEKEILVLKFWGEVKNKEIAEYMEMSVVNVNTTVFRALKKLRRIIEEEKVDF